MFSLVLGGCGIGPSIDTQDNAAVSAPVDQVDPGNDPSVSLLRKYNKPQY